jgi:hypothetical protein
MSDQFESLYKEPEIRSPDCGNCKFKKAFAGKEPGECVVVEKGKEPWLNSQDAAIFLSLKQENAALKSQVAKAREGLEYSKKRLCRLCNLRGPDGCGVKADVPPFLKYDCEPLITALAALDEQEDGGENEV